MYFSATRIFQPKETAFRCTGENEPFWVNATWLKHTLFEKKLMAFVWLWARPDFLHFYLDLLVISHVTTILLQYCAWRWREGKYTWKQENTLTLLLATHCIRETEAQRFTQAVRKIRKRTQMSWCLGLYSVNKDILIYHLGDPWKRQAEKNERALISSVLTVLAHEQQQLTWRQRDGYLPLLPDGQATSEAVHELLQFVA